MNAKERRFVSTVMAYYEKHGRHDLPWRSTRDPYHIAVSEVMLQQTQVQRVIEKYKEFLHTFPTVSALANAKLSQVLRVWSGLGYNRRAKFLHQMALAVVKQYKGVFPNTLDELRTLPGIGPYTAGALYAFAYNKPYAVIETNIRTVYMDYFFTEKTAVTDAELLPIISLTLNKKNPRVWYWALMDYGAHLKASGVRNNTKSKHYTKQSAFKGSKREVRGMVLKRLLQKPLTLQALMHSTHFERERLQEVLTQLEKEGLVKKTKHSFSVM